MEQQQKELVDNALKIGTEISDKGMANVTSGFYLLISALMMITLFLMLRKFVNDVLEQNKTVLHKLLEQNKEQTKTLEKISESFEEASLSRIKSLSSLAFDLSIEQVCKIIKKVIQENNISDKEGTREKIMVLLQNLHNDRNSKLDNFTYSGKELSYYTEDSWIDRMAKVIEREVYNDKQNADRTYTNVKLAYDTIKLEFYRNLRTK
ncbi:MAG: hypothetical protein KGV59_07645 [Tenacibaculum sp.]|nr:hypothetical protein [Tenacibaculum sp.]